jgi:protein-tyrosine phosphatase
MIPLADTHCHLLAGLDDGPRSREDALEMCRILCAEGVQVASATAHQNQRWREVTPERIREATRLLAEELLQAGLPLTVYPCAEVMAHLETVQDWSEGRLLSIADRGQYLLLEMPHGGYVDLRPTVRRLREAGLRPILAHPERQAELLEDAGRIEELIDLGCLVQISTGSVTAPPGGPAGEKPLRDWFRRGVVHLMGSDGHSPRRRAPRLADAYRQVVAWAGRATADRVFSTNGLAVLHGLPLVVSKPEAPRRSWLAAWLGVA